MSMRRVPRLPCHGLTMRPVHTQIFTTLVLTQDRLIVAGNVIQGTANSVLLWQTASTAASSAGAVSKQQSRLSPADNEDEVCTHPTATSATAHVKQHSSVCLNSRQPVCDDEFQAYWPQPRISCSSSQSTHGVRLLSVLRAARWRVTGGH